MSESAWIDPAMAVLDELLAGREPSRDDQRAAVKASLAVLTERAPGRSVEVVAGGSHRRGTPPAVVETDPATWLALSLGRVEWAEAIGSGRLRASGERSDLSGLLPLI
jgi:putative sterol carrier protein